MLVDAVLSLKIIVAAVTSPVNVVPPDRVTVTVPISVPTVLTETVPVVLIVRLEDEPLAVPVTVHKVIFAAYAPPPTVNVTPSAKVAANKLIAPVDVPPTVESPETVTAVVPKLITPVPAAVIVPLIIFELGDVAVTPPVNAIASPPFPNVTVPELLNVVAPAIVLLDPLNTTL